MLQTIGITAVLGVIFHILSLLSILILHSFNLCLVGMVLAILNYIICVIAVYTTLIFLMVVGTIKGIIFLKQKILLTK